jgi:hypothetical protein
VSNKVATNPTETKLDAIYALLRAIADEQGISVPDDDLAAKADAERNAREAWAPGGRLHRESYGDPNAPARSDEDYEEEAQGDEETPEDDLAESDGDGGADAGDGDNPPDDGASTSEEQGDAGDEDRPARRRSRSRSKG